VARLAKGRRQQSSSPRSVATSIRGPEPVSRRSACYPLSLLSGDVPRCSSHAPRIGTLPSAPPVRAARLGTFMCQDRIAKKAAMQRHWGIGAAGHDSSCAESCAKSCHRGGLILSSAPGLLLPSAADFSDADVSQSGESDRITVAPVRVELRHPRYEFSFACCDTSARACSATFFSCVISSIVGPKALVVG
jgi:hypothetical protein